MESLESRTLLSTGLSATAQLNLVSTTDHPSPVYNYDITVTNTGTTDIATFWFAWIPNEDFLPSIPTASSSPANWSLTLTGAHSSQDGAGIQWISNAGGAIAPGQSLSGFDFSSPDNPSLLAGLSPTHTTQYILTSTVYAGSPLADAGYQFIVTDTAAGPAPTAPSKTSLTASSTSPNLNDPVSFTAAVAPVTQGGAAPTGSVTFKDGTTPLGTFPLQTNGTAILNTSSLAAGTHSITATYSGDSTYVGSTSSTLAVTVSSTPGDGGGPANLVPQIESSTLPAAVVSGTRLHGVINMIVANSTVSPFAGPVTIDIYASTNGVIDDSSTLVTEIHRTLSLASNQTARVKVPITSLPDALPDGFYTLLAQAIDPSANANDSSTGVTVQVASPFVDLSEVFTKLTLPPAVVGGSKTKAAATLSISNAGNVTTSSSTTIDLFATTDGEIDGNATLIKSMVKSLHIKPGKAATVKVPLKMIPAVADGSYTIVARVTDQAAHTSSVAFDTPVNIAAPFVALAATLGPITPNSVSPAKSGSVTLTISNGGNILSSGVANIALSLSDDGQDTVGSLATLPSRLSIKPGASKVLHIHFKIPPGQTPGSFFLKALITQGIYTASAVSDLFVIS